MGGSAESGSKPGLGLPRFAPTADTSASATPAGLVADRFAVDGVEFVAFSWGASPIAPDVTAAEEAVLTLVLRGASNSDIARTRGVSTRTVANQVASLLRKLGAGSRYELVARYAGNQP